MTPKEILEYNKRCAEFLGYKYFPHPNEDVGWRKERGHLKFGLDYYLARTTKKLQFHLDWNWIMEVVEAIEKLGLNCKIGSFWATIEPKMASEINYKPLNIPHSQLDNDLSKKEATVQAINQFLIWYNEQRT